MNLGRVAGTVVATRKDEKLLGKKLLVVKILDAETGQSTGYQVCVDTVGAGVGELVITVGGSSARMATGMQDHPVDCSIVGIVDTVKLSRDQEAQK